MKAAAITSNRSHIFFQVDREIRVVELEGTNEVLLFTLSSSANSKLLVLDDGQEIALDDGGIIKRLRVR